LNNKQEVPYKALPRLRS